MQPTRNGRATARTDVLPDAVRRARPLAARARGVALLATTTLAHVPARAAVSDDGFVEWLPWLVLGAVALFVAGLVLRMVLAARFPKGYRAWARSRRDAFAERNDTWDRADEEFRK